MAKVGELILFSDCFKINPAVLKDMGVFNPILNLDTQLFIDPLLLKESKCDIIRTESVLEYETYFGRIISLLSYTNNPSDLAYRTAKDLFSQKEITGTCIGYGSSSTSGRRITKDRVGMILDTAKEIIDLGIKDPDLFSILSLFNAGIGPDTISDITTKAILKSLLKYTLNVAKAPNIPTSVQSVNGENLEVILNPLRRNGDFLVLLPCDILRNLPIVSDWRDVLSAAAFNGELRARVNKMVSSIFRQKTEFMKKKVISDILHDYGSVDDILRVVKGAKVHPYDFRLDNERLLVIDTIKRYLSQNQQSLKSNKNLQSDLNSIVCDIIELFRFLIEEKGLWKLLWKEDKRGRCKEGIPQLMFSAVAWSYCQANNIDINAEVDTGSGLIDFKFSRGASQKVIAELKYSDNQQLKHGLEVQLPQYMISEKAEQGYYVVLDVGHLTPKKVQNLENIRIESSQQCETVYIDAKIQKSASKK